LPASSASPLDPDALSRHGKLPEPRFAPQLPQRILASDGPRKPLQRAPRRGWEDAENGPQGSYRAPRRPPNGFQSDDLYLSRVVRLTVTG